MKTIRIICAWVSIALSFFLGYVSFSSSVASTASGAAGYAGTAALIVAGCFLFAGFIALIGNKSKAPTLVSGILYLVGGVLGVVGSNSSGDLLIWALVAMAFGILFIISAVNMKKEAPPELRGRHSR